MVRSGAGRGEAGAISRAYRPLSAQWLGSGVRGAGHHVDPIEPRVMANQPDKSLQLR